MSGHDDDVRWHRDHGWTENPEAATNWDNYEEIHYTLDPPSVPFFEFLTEGNATGELMAIDVDPEDRIWYISRGAPFVSHGDDTAQIGYIEPPYESDDGVPIEASTEADADATEATAADGPDEGVSPGLDLDDVDPEDLDEEDLDADQIAALHDQTGDPTIALELPVLVGGDEEAESGESGPSRELGGQAIAIDPDFEENGYVYVYYHPASDEYDTMENPYNEDIVTMAQRVSRFEFDGEELDPDSEEIILEIPLQLHTCCHIGGELEFGPEGYLYVATGDDSNNVGNPDHQVNWTMTDERQYEVHGRPAQVSDAQRTSGNTADLRGKVLRIDPQEDGSYEIPDGNLKDHWEAETGETYSEEEFLPEIYAMGLRNPFKINVDDHTGFLFIGSYGNDAGSWNHDLGTVGQGTYYLFDRPSNGGYPFFKGYYPNRRFDFETYEPGQPFWQDNLRNTSPNNTGIENIPNVTPALVWHPQSFDEYTNVAPWAEMPRPGEITWEELDEGGSADAGVAYRYRDHYGEGALDPYFDGKQFFQNPQNADNIRYLEFDEDGSLEIHEFLPDNGISQAHEMKVLSDGRLVVMGMSSGIHVIEYTGPQPEKKESADRIQELPAGLDGLRRSDETL